MFKTTVIIDWIDLQGHDDFMPTCSKDEKLRFEALKRGNYVEGFLRNEGCPREYFRRKESSRLDGAYAEENVKELC